MGLVSVTFRRSVLPALGFLVIAPNCWAQDPREILGNELWAWGWAGENSENVTIIQGTNGPLIRWMTDRSGRGNHFTNLGQPRRPAYQLGLTLDETVKGGAYHTDLPLIGLDQYADGSQVFGNVFYQESGLDAGADFYLAAVCMNTRTDGIRELFGTDSQNYVRLNQATDTLTIVIEGQGYPLSLPGSCPHGILLLEIWRDANGSLTCLGNGDDITTPGLQATGVFAVSGLGHDGDGNSHWDDYSMEYVFCDALPPADERDALREYLRAKWDVFVRPWTELTGTALAGAFGEPRLEGAGQVLGAEPFELRLSGAAPNAPFAVIFGASPLYAPFQGGVMVPFPEVFVFGFFTDSQGNLTLASTWPDDQFPDVRLWFQNWIIDPTAKRGWAASNGLIAHFAE